MEEHEEIRKKNWKQSENVKTHPQAIYTSRLLNFENLPEQVNSSDYHHNNRCCISKSKHNQPLMFIIIVIYFIISEFLDVQLSELDNAIIYNLVKNDI